MTKPVAYITDYEIYILGTIVARRYKQTSGGTRCGTSGWCVKCTLMPGYFIPNSAEFETALLHGMYASLSYTEEKARELLLDAADF